MALKDMTSDLKRLDTQIDSLEEALKPLIEDLPQISNEFPLLDKAKMFALTASAIESLLFASLRLQGVNTAEHPVMTDIKRVQQYFAKIKQIEEGPAQPAHRTLTVNTEAATRILKADLGENDSSLKKRLEEKLAEERAKALLNSMQKQKRPAPESPSANSSAPEKKQKNSRRKSSGKNNKS
ncbi:Exosome complex protein [Colletotrichum chlorophyti]|uniref:Exosome complex protein n=1 Tax=Colletotrichum chlorophyti TaxID=708187 RepID=A0A1Q8RP12_9PEZI|nr:Exosome complex protein [Colletotrichum chlorophyti]